MNKNVSLLYFEEYAYIMVKDMCKRIKTLTFIIKAVYSVYTGIFMVASQKEEIFWVFDLVG